MAKKDKITRNNSNLICSCDKCVSSCYHKPGWFLPEQIKDFANYFKIDIKNLLGEYVILEKYKSSYVALPKTTNSQSSIFLIGHHGQCSFLKNGKCSIHDVKPFECKNAMHYDTVRDDKERQKQIGEKWLSKEGKQVIEQLFGHKVYKVNIKPEYNNKHKISYQTHNQVKVSDLVKNLSYGNNSTNELINKNKVMNNKLKKEQLIEIFKDGINISVAYFIINSPNSRENIQGDILNISLTLNINSLENGFSKAENFYKHNLTNICRELHKSTIIQGKSKFLTFDKNEDYINVFFNNEKIIFRERDIIILPIENITPEEISNFILDELLLNTKSLHEFSISKISVKVVSNSLSKTSISKMRITEFT